MTIANKFAAKLSVAVVASAMILSSFAASASAQTTEELQQMINDLLAQVATLQAQVGGGDVVANGTCVSIMAPLTIGSQGADVTALQNALISGGYSIPAGATGYFGMQTQSALAAWQAANGVSPAVGYYGPITKAAMDAMCVADDSSDDMDDSEDEDMDDEDEDFVMSGEASLDTAELDDAEDDEIEEGAEDTEIGMLTLEFTDGDAELSRVDVSLTGSGDEQDPWDVFETISLWVDGDMIAEENADDEDDYLDEDDGSIRFSGLDLIAEEDEEVEIVIAATLQNSLDGVSDGEAWTLEVDALRFFDADGVATTESDPTGGDTATFTIEEEGVDDELIVKTSSSDPSATTLVLEDDSDSDWYSVFYFDLDTDDSENDIEINEVPVTVTVTGATTTLDMIIDDAELVIDGETIDDFAITNGALQSSTFVFDVDGDVVIDAGDRVEAELRLQFNALDSWNEGITVSASVDADDIDAEGADDLDTTQTSGTATGEDHSLITAGITVDADSVETTTDTSGDNDTIGEFEITFEVTAVEGDYYITDNAAEDTATDGVTYRLGGPATTTATTSGVLTSTADEDTDGVFTVSEGETEEFTLRVTADVATTGDYRVTLMGVYYSETSTGLGGVIRTLSPAQDYRTGYETIQAN